MLNGSLSRKIIGRALKMSSTNNSRINARQFDYDYLSALVKRIIRSNLSKMIVNKKKKEKCVGILLGATPVSAKIIYRKNIFQTFPSSRSLTVLS